MLEWLRYKWLTVVIVATLFTYIFCVCYDFINKRHKLKHHESYYLKKIFGVMIMAIGICIATYVIYVAVYNINSSEGGGLGVIIAFFVTLFISIPLLALGVYLICHKKIVKGVNLTKSCPKCSKRYPESFNTCPKHAWTDLTRDK